VLRNSEKEKSQCILPRQGRGLKMEQFYLISTGLERVGHRLRRMARNQAALSWACYREVCRPLD